MTLSSLMLALVTALCLPSTAVAALTVFSDRQQWAAAAGAHVTESFESLSLSELPVTGGVISTLHFDIIADVNHGRIGIFTDGYFPFATPGLSGKFFVGDVHDSANSRPHFNTFTFGQPIKAFAANFAALDDGGIHNVRILGESLGVLPRFDSGHSQSDFLGVVSSTPFTTVDIRNNDGFLERYGLDDVSFKLVPEPPIGILLRANLLLLLCFHSRRAFQVNLA